MGSDGTVISLTSIPPRFPYLGQTLETLLAQTVTIDEVRVTLPRRYRRFPDYAGEPPSLPKGVRLCWSEEDYGPATKVLPTVDDLTGEDVSILFCDDDMRFAPHWAKSLLSAGAERPDNCIALLGLQLKDFGFENAGGPKPRARPDRAAWNIPYRLRRVAQQLRKGRLSPVHDRPPRRLIRHAGYVDILQGYCGVLVRPEFFGPEAFDIPDEAWAVDDIWLSGMLTLKAVPIWCPAGPMRPVGTQASAQASLITTRINGQDRRNANQAAIQYLRQTYGIWSPA